MSTFHARALVGQLDARQVVVLADGQDRGVQPSAPKNGTVSATVALVLTPFESTTTPFSGTPASTAMSRITSASLKPLSPTPPETMTLLDQALLVELDRRRHAVAQRGRRPPVLVHLRAEDDDDVGGPPVVGLAEEEDLGDREEEHAGRGDGDEDGGRERAAGASAPAAAARPRR